MDPRDASASKNVYHNHHDHHDNLDRGGHDKHGDPDDYGDQEEVGTCMRKLEAVHKEVGGYRTRCACIAASIALNDEW